MKYPDKLNEKDLEYIEQYMSSVRFNLLTEGINIIYNLYPKEGLETWVHVYIKSPELQNSRFMTLFPFSIHGICNVSFTRKNDIYRVHQEFGVGSLLNNKEIFGQILEIGEGDEWKIQKYNEDIEIIFMEDALGLAKKLIETLTNKKFREVDERNVSEKSITYYPLPSLAHRFGILQFSDIYTGSEINLGKKYVKSLENSGLLENLVKYHNFFYGVLKNEDESY